MKKTKAKARAKAKAQASLKARAKPANTFPVKNSLKSFEHYSKRFEVAKAACADVKEHVARDFIGQFVDTLLDGMGLDSEPAAKAYMLSVVLSCNDVSILASYGLDPGELATIDERFRRNGIWCGNDITPFENEIEVALFALVGDGFLIRTGERRNGQYVYRMHPQANDED
ncbi:MAG: hypothetical protein ACKVP7_09825 [Hyphomicrobiaceae bacterium]